MTFGRVFSIAACGLKAFHIGYTGKEPAIDFPWILE